MTPEEMDAFFKEHDESFKRIRIRQALKDILAKGDITEQDILDALKEMVAEKIHES